MYATEEYPFRFERSAVICQGVLVHFFVNFCDFFGEVLDGETNLPFSNAVPFFSGRLGRVVGLGLEEGVSSDLAYGTPVGI